MKRLVASKGKHGETILTEVNFWGWLWWKIKRRKKDLEKSEGKKR